MFGHHPEELDAAQHGLDEADRQVSPRDRQGHPGQPGAASDVDHPIPLRDQFRDGGAVVQVPVPEPVHFPGADQPAFNAGAGKEVRVAASSVEPATAMSDCVVIGFSTSWSSSTKPR